MKTSNLVALLASILALTACGAGTVADGADDAADSNDALTTPGHFEGFVGQDGRYYFDLVAANGEIVLSSQSYASASGMKGGITSVKNNGTDPNRYELRQATEGSPYFVLTATNGQIIGVSELYSSITATNNAIDAVEKVVSVTAGVSANPVTGARFDVFKGLDNKYYFNLRAANGQIILQSQGYSTKTSANSGVTSVETNGTTTTRFEVRTAADSSTYFVLKAGNGAVIGMSQMYSTSAAANDGIQSVTTTLIALGK